MAKLVSAYVIYNAHSNSYVDDGTLITLNCEQLAAFTPRAVWLQRTLAPGDGTLVIYQPTFVVNSTDLTQYGTNMIQGFYVEQNGQGMIIDVANINTLISACNACCDDSPTETLTRYYTSGIPLFANPTEKYYCITRLDDGSATAHQDAALAYTSQYHGNFRHISNVTGVSIYRVTSFTGWPPVARGTDTVAAC